jgi:hypothetical protein
VIDAVEIEAEGAPHHETQIQAAPAALLHEAAQGNRVELLASAVEQGDVGPLRESPSDLLILANLDQFDPGVAGQELLIVLDIIGEGRPQPAHGDDEDSHGWDTTFDMNDADRNERRINIHFSPEIMAGSYANFANVSHSDYEFTITFARVDHEVEDEEIPGVVVSRINLSSKFMRELIDAMQDNYSKWETREGIKNLPEYGGTEPPPPSPPPDA